MSFPATTILFIGIMIVFASFSSSVASRRNYTTKRVVRVLPMQQKKEREDLLLSIFPKSVANDMLEKQSSSTFLVSKQSLQDIDAQNYTVARMHQNVTILFTGESSFFFLLLFLSLNALFRTGFLT